jgi:hypothetical protein
MATKEERDKVIKEAAKLVRSGSLFVRRAINKKKVDK